MEKYSGTATATELSPFLEQAKTSKFRRFYHRHKRLVIAAAAMIVLLPLLGLLALLPRGSKGSFLSPVAYPSRECLSLKTFWLHSFVGVY
jgi:hypothetical protein